MPFWLALILLLASFVQGLTGFGLALVSVALLSLFLEPTISVPLAGIYGWLISFPLTFQLRKSLNTRVAIFLFIGSIPGSFLGAWLLRLVNKDFILIVMGLVLLVSGIQALLRKHKKKIEEKNSPLINIVLGFLSGSLGAAVGEPGPPVIAYLGNKPWSAEMLKGTLSLFFMLQMIGAILGFYINDLIDIQLGTKLLWALPGFIIGTLLGLKCFKFLQKSKLNYAKLVHILLIIIGLRLLYISIIDLFE